MKTDVFPPKLVQMKNIQYSSNNNGELLLEITNFIKANGNLNHSLN